MKSKRLNRAVKWGLGLFLLYVVWSLVWVYIDNKRISQAEKAPKNILAKPEATIKAKEFCEKIGIICGGEVSLADSPARVGIGAFIDRSILTRMHIDSETGDEYEYYGANVIFGDNEPEKQDEIVSRLYFGIGRKSREIESYRNLAIYDTLLRQYGWKIKSEEFPSGRIDYPGFIAKEKAEEIFVGLTNKIGIPSDMVLKEIAKNDKYGIWNAIWVRTNGGYQYEGDGITMSIMGATGDLISYQKKYRGLSCPTDVKIDRNAAIHLAWKKLRWKNPWLIFWKASDIYDIKTDIRIIPVGEFVSNPNPVTFKESRLSWIIKFRFTGGLNVDLEKFFAGEPVPDEKELFYKYRQEIEGRRTRMFLPEGLFEVRIDAGAGDCIYISRVTPWYSKWFMKLYGH